jgi:catechol-2,3-dioxygenase
MAIMVGKISAVTFRVSNMKASVQFYRDVLGMDLLYGGEGTAFSSEKPRNASWGERYFHMLDPDGHELSFARPLRPAA